MLLPGLALSAEKSVIVGFHQMPETSVMALTQKVKDKNERRYHLINAISARLSEEEIEDLKKNKNVAYIEEDGIVMAAQSLEYINAWGVLHISADIAHASGNKGAGVKIAVIDTGIDYTHEDLDGNYAGGYDFVFDDNDPFDDNTISHGTHVAGIIAAEENGIGVIGVAPEAELYAIKVLDGAGFGLASWVIAALEWAVDNGMDIANLSLEGPHLESLQAACDNAYNAGVLLVAAGGNTNGGPVSYPAAYESVIAVTGTDADDVRAYFSPVGPELELAAPGVDILSTVVPTEGNGWSYYSSLSGTSQAAPHVAGTAALLFSANPQDANGDGMINDEVREILQITALDLGDQGRDSVYGFGLVNAVAVASFVSPPVRQEIGIQDGVFNNLVETDCRLCHDDPGVVGSTPNADRHHLLYGVPFLKGKCSVNREDDCLSDADCDSGICSAPPEESCSVDSDCDDFTLGETCGEVCTGETVVPNLDANQDGIDDTTYGCLSCHDQDTSGGVITFLVERDCLQCHVQVPGEASVHHLTAKAQGINSPLGDPAVGDCTPCHGTLVDDIGDGHVIPTYDPSSVTPGPSGGTGLPLNSEDNGAGACNYCHSSGTGDSSIPGTDTATGTLVYGNSVTHHNTGVYRSETGVTNYAACLWCHDFTPLPAEYAIRTCEGCHGLESLHNIQADSDASGDIVVGGELPGYGHVGADNPGAGSDCWGCHGFSTVSAPDSGPIVPSIIGSDVLTMTAGTDTAIILTGSAFTNLMDAFQWTSNVVLTAADASWVTLTPDSITQGSLTVTIPGTTATGNYTLQAVKDENTASNPVALSIKPEVVIIDVSCEEDLLTITGSGFGDAPPEGAEEYLNVEVDGLSVEITSWADTEITASVSSCGMVTVNALYGSATYENSDCGVCNADSNHDGAVDLNDLVIMRSEYTRSDCDINPCQADCNGDGSINLLDLIIMKIEFLKEDCCL